MEDLQLNDQNHLRNRNRNRNNNVVARPPPPEQQDPVLVLDLERPIRILVPPGAAAFCVEHCKFFTSFNRLEEHRIYLHRQHRRTFLCPSCLHVFSSRFALNRHRGQGRHGFPFPTGLWNGQPVLEMPGYDSDEEPVAGPLQLD